MGKKTLWVATTNKGKLGDFHSLLPEYEIKSLYDLPRLLEIEEDQDTFEGNSAKKANELFELIQAPVIADDSGLMIHGLDNFPGVHSARWATPETDWTKINNRILHKMQEAKLVTPEERSATFKTVITYKDAKLIKQFFGELEGTIATAPRGTNGFGYAPIFIPNGLTKTQAELSDEERSQQSHRGRAMEQLKVWLETREETNGEK